MEQHFPTVSVIMPVYNTAQYVGEAIRSVLDQTFRDLELIVVDDGSVDGSETVVRSFDDPRIRFERQSPNRGVSRTLNRALELARGTYIARHDSDDVSLPDRLRKQVTVLDADPAIGILGTYASTMTAAGDPFGAIEHHPITDAPIRFAQFFDSAFVSSTVVFRRALLDRTGGFDEVPERPVWDDYDMWSRLLRHTKAANIPEHLLRYRLLSTGLTGTTTHAQAMVREQRRRNVRAVIPNVDDRTLELFAYIGFRHSRCTSVELRRVHGLLHALVEHCAPTPSERTALEALARTYTLSFHLNDRSTSLHKVVDVLMKQRIARCAPHWP